MSTEEYSDIEKFDRAVFDYLTTISGTIVYAPTQNALKIVTKREKFSDKKPWNFISFYRTPQFDVNWERMNNPGTVFGHFNRLTGTSDTDRVARYTQDIPVNLTYEVELWASKSTQVQNLAISLITKIFMQDQVLEVPINPDGEDGRFHILDVGWSDNSDLERETEIGKIYRHTVTFTIDARILLTTNVNTTRFCCVPVNIYEDSLEDYTYERKENNDENQESN